MSNSLASEHRNSPKACQLESPKKALTYFILPVLAILFFIGYVMTHANVATCLSNYLPLALLTCACWLQVPLLRPWVLQLGMVPLLSLSWIVLLGRLILPLLAGPHWLASMAELYHVHICWLVVGDIALHFGCFFAVQWLWLRCAKSIQQTWLCSLVWQRWLSACLILLPYGIWLYCVDPLVVYKVPLHLPFVQYYFGLYGISVTTLCYGCVSWVFARKRVVGNVSRVRWAYLGAMVLTVGFACYFDAVSLPLLVQIGLVILYTVPVSLLFLYWLTARVR